jgi:hypothetical protein
LNTRRWSIVHLALTLILVTWSGLSNSGLVFERTVGDVSEVTRNAFTPASWAFSIWGLIYLALVVMTVFGVRRAFSSHRPADFVHKLGWPFALAQVACSLWLAVWLQGAVLASLGVMTVLLASLYLCIRRLEMERWDAPWPIIGFVWWPMSLYFGWITAAWVANVSSALVVAGLEVPRTAGWAVAAAVALTALHLALIVRRNMRESAMVAVWALVAVGARHWGGPLESIVFWGTSLCAGALLLAAALHGARNFRWPPPARSSP